MEKRGFRNMIIVLSSAAAAWVENSRSVGIVGVIGNLETKITTI